MQQRLVRGSWEREALSDSWVTQKGNEGHLNMKIYIKEMGYGSVGTVLAQHS